MLRRASKDPTYFIDNFLWTFNPKQEPYHFEFKLFPFQYDLVYDIKEAIETGNDIFIEKCREMGATYTILAVLLWFWRFVPGSNFLVGSRKEDYVDNTKGDSGELSNKEESLFGKLEYFLNRIDPLALPLGFNIQKHLNYMSLVNPENGNVISGESSNPNFSRGGRQKAILLDEFAFWEDANAVWGSTADTTSCRIVLTTPGIKPSKAKRLRFGEDGEKIKVITLTHQLDPRKDADWIAREKERRSAEDFAREIMINWEGSIEGRVYPEIRLAEVGRFPYDPAWGIYWAWDFGLDATSIGAWQINPLNGKLRLVDSYEYSDLPIQYAFPLLGRPIDSLFTYEPKDLEAITAFKLYRNAIHFGDPDVNKRSYQSREAKSTRRELEGIGVYIQTKPESNDFITRREKTKVWLQRGIEVNDTQRNKDWLEKIKNARYPQPSENSQATSEVAKPIHDWTSHARSSMEYFCVNVELPESFSPPPKTMHEKIMQQLEGQVAIDDPDGIIE
jgi:ribosomal protein S16